MLRTVATESWMGETMMKIFGKISVIWVKSRKTCLQRSGRDVCKYTCEPLLQFLQISRFSRVFTKSIWSLSWTGRNHCERYRGEMFIMFGFLHLKRRIARIEERKTKEESVKTIGDASVRNAIGELDYTSSFDFWTRVNQIWPLEAPWSDVLLYFRRLDSIKGRQRSFAMSELLLLWRFKRRIWRIDYSIDS